MAVLYCTLVSHQSTHLGFHAPCGGRHVRSRRDPCRRACLHGGGGFPCTWTAPRRWRPRRSFPAPQVAKQPCALSVPLLGASPARLAAPLRWALWMVHPDGVPGRMHEAVRCIGGLLDIARTDTPSVLRLDTPPHWPCVAATLLVGRGRMPAVRTAAVKLGAALVGERDVGLARGTSAGSIAAVCVAGRWSCVWGGDTRTPERGIEPLLGAEGGVGGVTDAPAAAASAAAAVVAAAASAATTAAATSAHTAAAAARLRGRPLVHSAIAAGGGGAAAVTAVVGDRPRGLAGGAGDASMGEAPLQPPRRVGGTPRMYRTYATYRVK